jgi:hypothetical protein
MSSTQKKVRYLFAVMGFALALPVAMSLAADVASASGYMVASGFENVPHCTPGGGDECPPDGIIEGGQS